MSNTEINYLKKILYLLPIILAVGIISTISLTQSEAEASHASPQIAHVKAVVNFEHSADQPTVENFYINNVKPALGSIISTYSSNIDNFEAEYRPDNEVLYIIGFNGGTGKNIFEFYPKATFFGDLPDGVTQTQFDTAFDNFLTDIKNEMRDQMVSNGATDITYHIHYTTGSIDG